MSFKRKALGLVAALGLALSVAAPAVAQDVYGGTAPIEVTLQDNGQFAVSIASASLGGLSVNAESGGTSTGLIKISYIDSKSYRQGFYTELSASDFQSKNIRTRAYKTDPGGQPFKIDANNLKVTKNYDTYQGRWSGWSSVNQGYAVGDIGPTSNGDDHDGSSGPFNSACTDLTGPFAGKDCHDWTNAVNNTLKQDGDVPLVTIGHSGPGTAGTAGTAGGSPTYGTDQYIAIQLTVPAGQPADVYTSTLTVTVLPENVP